MSHASRWLDVLTECVLAISDLNHAYPTPREWLPEAASTLHHRFGPRTGVALLRVGPAESRSGWSHSLHAVRCGDPEESAEWRERYTSATVASGLTPRDYLEEGARDWHVWQSGDPLPDDPLGAFIDSFIRRHHLGSFAHCCGPMAPGGADEPKGALVLDFWTLDRREREELPPKAFCRNLARAIQICLLRVELGSRLPAESGLDRLTPSQRRVAALLMEGHNEREVANQLDRSPHTVHQHVKAIYAAFSVRSRAEFMAACIPMTTTGRANIEQRASSEEKQESLG